LEAEITIEYKDVKDAEAVAKAVSPDNLKMPSGLSVKTARKLNRVLTQIKCPEKLPTFIATIDDLLFCISVAEKTLVSIKNVNEE
jgi:tRNA threonylcarbamoyladenosine modification (KEOPS) complex  Pcc1 subunit